MNISVGVYIVSLILILSLLIIICTMVDILYSNEYYESKINKNTIVKAESKSLQKWLSDDNYSVIIEEDNHDDTV